MNEPTSLPPPETAVTTPTPAPVAAPQPEYRGNNYDLYALLAGTLGGTVLALCFTFNTLLYCLPLAPLALGIIALRNSRAAVDPQRTRNLAWVGIAGGAVGTLALLIGIALFILYFVFIFTFFGNFIRSVPQRP